MGWFKSDGDLKGMMAWVVMLAMHRDAVIALSPPRMKQGRLKPLVFGADTDPRPDHHRRSLPARLSPRRAWGP